MKQFKFGVVIVLGLLLSGCASAPGKTGWYDQWGACAAAGTAAGMAVGATDDFDTAMYGAAGGFVVGGLICGLSDTDADGVKNFKDKCPGTAAGAIVDENGCEKPSEAEVVDSDGDGVSDDRDRCPGTPAGVKVDEYGCELDDDGDGVVNSKDKCPETPPGVAVDNFGCTLEEKYALKHVNFEFDSAKLTAESTASLDEAVQILQRHSELKVEIAGHTDSTGTDEYNLGLSKRRAQAVVDYLVAHGANAGNIMAQGYGESEPVADNATDTGRAANRRVELRH